MEHKRLVFDNGKFLNEEIISGNADIVEEISTGKKLIYENLFIRETFTDSHIHLFGLGMKLSTLSLFDCKDADECMQKCIDYRGAKRGNWLVGIGWSDYKIPLSRKILDSKFNKFPVYLIKSDGHTACCNSLALQALDNFPKSICPEILESGIITGNEKEFLNSVLPPYSSDQEKEMIYLAVQHLMSLGVFAVCDMDTEQTSIDALFALENERKLLIDVYLYLNRENIEYYYRNYSDTEHIKLKGMKCFADGTLGSQSAAMLISYLNSNNFGVLNYDEKQLTNEILFANDRKLDFAVHCIGDRAASTVVSAMLKARKLGAENILRMEHCQMVREEDMSKMGDASVIASLQPYHCIADFAAGIIQKSVSTKHLKNVYRWNSLIENCIPIIAGSDAPIETENPLDGIKAFCGNSQPDAVQRNIENINFEIAFAAYSENPNMYLRLNKSKYYNGVLIFERNLKLIEVKSDFIKKIKNN